MIYQDHYGVTYPSGKDIPIDKFGEYFLIREVQKIGDMLGLEGKFIVNYGTDTIQEKIKELRK